MAPLPFMYVDHPSAYDPNVLTPILDPDSRFCLCPEPPFSCPGRRYYTTLLRDAHAYTAIKTAEP